MHEEMRIVLDQYRHSLVLASQWMGQEPKDLVVIERAEFVSCQAERDEAAVVIV
jgi:hypothetical protein